MSEKICVTSSGIGLGIDIAFSVDMEDVESGGVGVLLTQNEWSSIEGFPDRLQRMAGKLAGKEAVMKALGRGLGFIELVDIEICNDAFGKPDVFLTGSALAHWRQRGLNQLEISISHHKGCAVGVAMVL